MIYNPIITENLGIKSELKIQIIIYVLIYHTLLYDLDDKMYDYGMSYFMIIHNIDIKSIVLLIYLYKSNNMIIDFYLFLYFKNVYSTYFDTMF